MKSIILAAGYATRLYPLTINQPKALLPINGRAILDYITDEIEKISEIDEIIVVSNDKFYLHFCRWSEGKNTRIPISVLNDGTTDDSNKLGGVGDIWYAIENKDVDDDILVMAGDNIFTFSLADYYNEYKRLGTDMILVKELDDVNELRRMANVTVDENGRVTNMVEKPQNPESNIAAFASYIYRRDTLPLIKKYLDGGNNPDAPGFFPSWLFKQKAVHAYRFNGECYDIGTPESYAEVNEIFK